MPLNWIQSMAKKADTCLKTWMKPATDSLIGGTAADLVKSKPELIAENAFLRQQVIVLKRQVKQPKLSPRDRGAGKPSPELEECAGDCQAGHLVEVAPTRVQAFLAAPIQEDGASTPAVQGYDCVDPTDGG
jgi:hypothetical protein